MTKVLSRDRYVIFGPGPYEGNGLVRLRGTVRSKCNESSWSKGLFLEVPSLEEKDIQNRAPFKLVISVCQLWPKLCQAWKEYPNERNVIHPHSNHGILKAQSKENCPNIINRESIWQLRKESLITTVSQTFQSHYSERKRSKQLFGPCMGSTGLYPPQ